MQCIHCILMRGGLGAYSIPIKAGGGGGGKNKERGGGGGGGGGISIYRISYYLIKSEITFVI